MEDISAREFAARCRNLGRRVAARRETSLPWNDADLETIQAVLFGVSELATSHQRALLTGMGKYRLKKLAEHAS